MYAMMVTWSNGMLCPKKQWWSGPAFEATAECRFSRCRFDFVNGIWCFSNGSRFAVRIANGYSRTKLYSVSNYEGVWEDPDDGSDDSENEDDADFDDENEDMEENDLDYESDWEAEGNAEAAVDKADELFTRKYEEDLFKEVEQLRKPEEREILLMNEAPDRELIDCNFGFMMEIYCLILGYLWKRFLVL